MTYERRPVKPTARIFQAAAPGVQHGAPAAFAVGIDEIGNRCFDPGLGERGDCKPPLPSAVGVGAPVLHRAAAAGAEMRGQTGSMRSGLGTITRSNRARSPCRSASTVSPGKASGASTRAFRRLGDGVAAVAHAGDGEGLLALLLLDRPLSPNS